MTGTRKEKQKRECFSAQTKCKYHSTPLSFIPLGPLPNFKSLWLVQEKKNIRKNVFLHKLMQITFYAVVFISIYICVATTSLRGIRSTTSSLLYGLGSKGKERQRNIILFALVCAENHSENKCRGAIYLKSLFINSLLSLYLPSFLPSFLVSKKVLREKKERKRDSEREMWKFL